MAICIFPGMAEPTEDLCCPARMSILLTLVMAVHCLKGQLRLFIKASRLFEKINSFQLSVGRVALVNGKTSLVTKEKIFLNRMWYGIFFFIDQHFTYRIDLELFIVTGD